MPKTQAKLPKRAQIAVRWSVRAVLAVMALYVLVFSDASLLRVYKLKKEYNQLAWQKAKLDTLNASMKTQLAGMADNNDLIERIAREQYGMQKPGETIYRFVPKKPEAVQ